MTSVMLEPLAPRSRIKHYTTDLATELPIELDCIMSSIPLLHKCLSNFLIWVIVSQVVVVSKKVKKNVVFFTFLNWENQTWYWEKGFYFFYWEWGQN